MAMLSFDGINGSVLVKIGNAGEITVNVDKFNEEVLRHVFNYGLKQILNDTRSAEKDADKAMALVEKKLAALFEGKVRASGERETDPVRAEARKIATQKVDAAIKAKGKKKDEVANYAELVKTLAARADIMEMAKARVEALKLLGDDTDILAELVTV